MKKLIWLLGSGTALVLFTAAIADEKPQRGYKWQALPQFLQVTEVSVTTEAPQQRCPCCELTPACIEAACEAPLWLMASHWLKPLALGWQFAPFLGYVDQNCENDPQVIVAQFIRDVTRPECVPAACHESPVCPFACGTTGCTAAVAAGAKCKCAECKCGANCKCCATAAACKDGVCSKNCTCPTAKCGTCCAECKAAQGCPCADCKITCEAGCCPFQAAMPRGIWMRHPMQPMAPPAFGIQWAPIMVPFPGMDAQPPVAHMPSMPHGIMPQPMHPMAGGWHMPTYPRILPPVVEEHFESSVAQSDTPSTPFHPVSRAVRRPTVARPVSMASTTANVGNRVRYSTAAFEATCDRLSYMGNVVVLEGDVQLVLCNNPQAGRISAQWVEVNLDTGAFGVHGTSSVQAQQVQMSQPLPQSGIVPTSCKPDTTNVPTIRPVQR